jgi:hypothetical protein
MAGHAQGVLPGVLGNLYRRWSPRGADRLPDLLESGTQGIVATHGNRGLSFPDIYELRFRDASFEGLQRVWTG